jgi:hypothetical protein
MFINEELVQTVLKTWTADQNHPHRGKRQRAIPETLDFGILIDTMFTASLLKEEGESVSCSVAWISAEDFRASQTEIGQEAPVLLEFNTPLDFNARTVGKLNGLVNGKTGALLVFTIEGSVKIWGVGYFVRASGPLGQIPLSMLELSHFVPDFPMVTITGAGSIKIARGGSVIGRIEGGKFLVAEATVLSLRMLGQYLYKLIGVEVDLRTKKLISEADGDRSTIFFQCVETIIDLLAQRRSGATIIFSPPVNPTVMEKIASTAWKTNGSLKLDQLQGLRSKCANDEKQGTVGRSALQRLYVDRVLVDRLRNIVDLARIDGALLLSPSFEVISFGTKLKADKWNGTTEHGPLIQPVAKQELVLSQLGTRHNSAVDFVGQVDGAIAFVASSDGPIRAFVRSTEDKIWYWPDCRVSMFSK